MSTKQKSEVMRFLEKITGGPLTIAQLLRAIREGEELSQVQFAKKLGILRTTLCDIEKGRRFIDEKLAKALQKS